MKEPASRLERRHIDTLLAVAETGSIHAAARALGLPQPLLTKLLQDAERIVGRQVFTRSHKGCTPRPDAADVLSSLLYASKALGALDEAQRGMGTRLRLGCSPRASHSLMPLLLQRLGTAPQGLQVSVVEATAMTLASYMADGRIDCMIGRQLDDAEGVDPGEYVVENLYEERTILVARPRHPLLAKRRITPADLVQYPWVLPRPGSYSRTAWSEMFSRHGLRRPDVVVESLSFLSSLHLASRGDFLSIGPDRIVRRFEALRLLQKVKTGMGFGAYMVALTYHPGLQERPGFAQLLGTVRAIAGEIREDA